MSNLSRGEIQQKIEAYCVYQERCEQEIRKKLLSWNVSVVQQDEIISYLAQNNFWNEQRYADSFVSGKLNIRRWGKLKIKRYLLEKNISKTVIQQALIQIDPQEYRNTLHELILKKQQSLSTETNLWKKKNKIINYLMGKGYELEEIYRALEEDSAT